MWATLMDKYGFRTVFSIIMFIQMIVASAIYYTRYNEVLYVIMVALSYLCEGGHFSCFPAMICQVFGITNGGVVATLAHFVVPIASISSFIFVWFNANNQLICGFGAVLSAVNLCILYNFDDKKMVRNTHGSMSEKEPNRLINTSPS
jgi:hypothetical protein